MAAPASAPKKKRAQWPCPAAAVKLVIEGAAVKIVRGADAGVIAAVTDALKTR